ncbi:MAG TPA: hypothetical protein VF607_10475, partial [Verrucomicrobiae bacterium]
TYVRGKSAYPRAAEWVLALGGWGLLQALAIAFARTDQVNCSRYGDLFNLLPIASLASWFILDHPALWPRLPSRQQTLLAAGWSILILAGLYKTSPHDWSRVDDGNNYALWSAQARLTEAEDIRSYLLTGNSSRLGHHPEANATTNQLTDPNLQSRLPELARRPLCLSPANPSETPFIRQYQDEQFPARPWEVVWANQGTNGSGIPGRFLSQSLSPVLSQMDWAIRLEGSTNGVVANWVESGSEQKHPLALPAVGGWQSVHFATPPGPFQIEVTAANPGSLVVLGEITARGRFSYPGQTLIDQAGWLFLAGILLWCGAAIREVALAQHAGQGFRGPLALLILSGATLVFVGWFSNHFSVPQFKAALYHQCAENAQAAGHPELVWEYRQMAVRLAPENTTYRQAWHGDLPH